MLFEVSLCSFVTHVHLSTHHCVLPDKTMQYVQNIVHNRMKNTLNEYRLSTCTTPKGSITFGNCISERDKLVCDHFIGVAFKRDRVWSVLSETCHITLTTKQVGSILENKNNIYRMQIRKKNNIYNKNVGLPFFTCRFCYVQHCTCKISLIGRTVCSVYGPPCLIFVGVKDISGRIEAVCKLVNIIVFIIHDIRDRQVDI